jgi:hypothetical protein
LAPRSTLIKGKTMATRKAKPETTNDKHAFSSGATSSEHLNPFHLIPTQTIRKLAQRFALGAAKHGDVNYQKCIRPSDDGRLWIIDIAFARDRYNHIFEHLLQLKQAGQFDKNGNPDDNIAAALWGTSFLAWVESFGFSWHRILNPRQVNETELAILRVKNNQNGKLHDSVWVKTSLGKCFKD